MTVKEYNKEFLPKIVAAEYVAHNLELAIDHAQISDEAKEEVLRHLRIHACWSEETKRLILKALDYYREHEGIDKLETPEITERNDKMTLRDLTTGMIVTTRNGQEWTVFRNYSCTMASTEENSTDGVLVRGINDWLSFSAYNGDMTTNFECYDIVKVEISSHPCSMMYHDFRKNERRLIWEREPVKEITMEEVEAMFGCRVKIVP